VIKDHEQTRCAKHTKKKLTHRVCADPAAVAAPAPPAARRRLCHGGRHGAEHRGRQACVGGGQGLQGGQKAAQPERLDVWQLSNAVAPLHFFFGSRS
jgi:hypothetical protein